MPPSISEQFTAIVPVRASVGLLGLLAALGGCSEERGAGERGAGGNSQRLVLVTLDTLRQDALFGAGDADAGVMARTRAFAARGRVFSRHLAASATTQPTHASLLTGLHPWQHGVGRNGLVLADSIEGVAETLAGLGFRTAAVVASFPLHEQFNLDQGFEVYVDDFDQKGSAEWNEREVEGGAFSTTADRVVARALELLDATPGPRQFFWFHFFDPHSPYGDRDRRNLGPPVIRDLIRSGRAPPKALLQEARDAYRNDVRFMDEALGRLFERLDDGVPTHVIVVADHGESLGEDGVLGHGTRLTPEQIQVPLFIVSPRLRPEEVDLPVGSVDVAATLLALAGAAPPRNGRDLTQAVIEPAPVFGMRRLHAEPHEEIRSDGREVILQPEDHLYYMADRGGFYVFDGRLVRLGDGGEELADAGRAAALRALYAAFERELSGAAGEELLDAETQRLLREMGYVR